MLRRPVSIAAWTIAVVAIAFGVAAFAFGLPADVDGRQLEYLPFALTYGVVGALITSRRPRNAVGWIFLAAGMMAGVRSLTWAYAMEGLFTDAGPRPASSTAAWVSAWIDRRDVTWLLLPLLFPSGRPLTPRWRVLLWADLAMIPLLIGEYAFAFDKVYIATDRYVIANPYALGTVALFSPINNTIGILGLLLMLASIWSLAWRYAHSAGAERQQIKWSAYAVLLMAVAVATGFVLGAAVGAVGWRIAGAGFYIGILALPIAAAAAIFRYRLYGIDLLINRTVAYTAITVVLAAFFALLTAVLQRGVETVTGERSDLATLGGVLAAAVAFGPLRRRVQPIVDQLLPARGVLTLLFTDIVGSTERIVAIGDERWRTVLEAYRAAVRRELARFDGREVDTAGDGFFATFERPARAVGCAVALRDTLHALGLDSRVGLHTGECELRGERVSGLNVIVAARLMAVANANEIVVSKALCEEIPDSTYRFAEARTERLKGVPGEWRLKVVEEAAPLA